MITTIRFRPSRIGCPSIPATMKGMIVSIKGVEEVKVYYEDRSVDVTFDDAVTNEKEIIAVVGKEMGLALEVVAAGDKREGGIDETCPM